MCSDESVKSDGVKDGDRENGNDSGTYGSDYNYYNSNSVCSFNSVDSKKDDSSVTYALSEIKFLEDEPLYQFYDEIVSKVSHMFFRLFQTSAQLTHDSLIRDDSPKETVELESSCIEYSQFGRSAYFYKD